MAAYSGEISGQNVKIESGDLTLKECDAYVVPQFNSCVSEGGVGGAIIRAGASQGMEAYQHHLDKHGGKLEFGNACLTTSGGGNSKYLLHVVSVDSPGAEEFSIVQKAIYSALLQAEKRGIKTIAAPALGTGTLGNLTPTQSAKAMMSAIALFAKNGGKFDRITLVIFGPDLAREEFIAVMANKAYENVSHEAGQKRLDLESWVNQAKADLQANSMFNRRN